MMPQVSFGSTYKINQSLYSSVNQQRNLDELLNQCDKQNYQYKEDLYKTSKTERSATIVVPDCCDSDIEGFCNAYGIPFKKWSTDDLTQPCVINNRIKPAPKGMQTVKIDVNKFEKLLDSQKSNNIAHCERDYHKYYSDDANFILKSGDAIPATTLYLTPLMGNEDMLDYIARFGAENINEDSIMVDFAQKTDDPDHCMFFAMKEAGMKEIPVYMNNYGKQLAQELGILV